MSRITPPPCRTRRPEQGFVLIAVLGMIMALSLVGAFVANYAENRTEQAWQLRQRWQNDLDLQATEATLLHLVATRERAGQGYMQQRASTESSTDLTNSAAQLAADGRGYMGVGSAGFALQDEGALLSVLEPNRTRWLRWLDNQGLSPAEADRVLDLIYDYTDQDDLRRLNGATSADYTAQDKTPPSGRFMVGPGQMHNLLDAGRWQGWLARLLPLLTARSGELINLNTMPGPLLATLPGLDEQTANELVAERQQQPFASLQDANQRLGKLLPVNAMNVPQVISPFTRFLLWNTGANCGQIRQIGLSLSPSSTLAPWEIDYAYTLDHDDPCPSVKPVVVASLFQPPVAD